MRYRPDELADRLKAEGTAVLEYFRKLTPQQWGHLMDYSGPAWQVRDVLAHFIAAEMGFQHLIQNIAAGGSGARVDFDIDEYNLHTVNELRAIEFEVLLGQYAMTRERTVALVLQLRPEQLDMTGYHPALGEATLEEAIRMIFFHNSLHLRDVRQTLKASGSSSQVQPGVA